MELMLGIMLLPFLGTTLGAAMVFFLRRRSFPGLETALLGFAAGVMMAASVWSLLLPAMEQAEAMYRLPWVPAVAGVLLGTLFLLGLDHLTAGMLQRAARGSGMLLFAVTLHNVPEGMAVGVACAGFMTQSGILLPAVLALSVGIAVQNVPEGAILSLPLRGAGMGRLRAFWLGTLSGAVEPLAAFLTLVLAAQVTAALPWLLSFAAGAMLYVVIRELIPKAQKQDSRDIGVVGAALGFALMMLLDVVLG